MQRSAPTVQGELERALATICGEPVRVIGAGRTDAGVHASGQVVSFRSATKLDGAGLGRGVNALLPEDIAVAGCEAVGDEFHARFSATGRTYEYRIRNAPERDVLERHREHWVPDALDDRAAAEASRHLVGERDFSAFAALGAATSTGKGARGAVRAVRRAEWRREGPLVRFEIEADAFLRGMVRAIVGTLLWVARGKIGAEEMDRIIGSRDRTKAGPSAPARGLCLVAVSYDGTSRSGEGRDDDDE